MAGFEVIIYGRFWVIAEDILKSMRMYDAEHDRAERYVTSMCRLIASNLFCC